MSVVCIKVLALQEPPEQDLRAAWPERQLRASEPLVGLPAGLEPVPELVSASPEEGSPQVQEHPEA